ncbi:hypothetical protein ACLB2K_037890 [Fragaria x ananassa]
MYVLDWVRTIRWTKDWVEEERFPHRGKAWRSGVVEAALCARRHCEDSERGRRLLAQNVGVRSRLGLGSGSTSAQGWWSASARWVGAQLRMAERECRWSGVEGGARAALGIDGLWRR